MENFSSETVKAYYDHRRFPTVWQAMLGCTLMQFTVLVPMMIIEFFSLGNSSRLFRTAFGEYMYNGILSQFFAVLIIPLLFLLIFKKDMRATLRLKKNIDIVQIFLLLFLSIGVFLGVQLINSFFITGLTSFMGQPSDVSTMPDATNISQLLFELVIVAGLPAICEEFFFRGFVMRAFERHSPIVAIILSSATFAIMHGNLQQILYAFILGLILGSVVMLTDSILAGTVMHFTLNATSIILSYPPIYAQYEAFVMNHPFAYVIIALCLVVLIAVPSFILLFSYTKKKNLKTYQMPFVSEMDCRKLMPKPASWETAITVLGWIGFIGLNILSMLTLWYYDVLMGVANQV